MEISGGGGGGLGGSGGMYFTCGCVGRRHENPTYKLAKVDGPTAVDVEDTEELRDLPMVQPQLGGIVVGCEQ